MKLKAVGIFLFATAFCFAQEPVKKGGFQFSAGTAIWQYEFNSEEEYLFGAGGSVKYNLLSLNTDLAINLLSRPATGIHFKSNNDKESFVSAEIPLLLEMSIGHLATKDFRSDAGFAAGAGHSFTFFKDEIINSYILSAALRWWALNQSFTLRFISYLPFTSENRLLNSLSLEINLGKYIAVANANNKITRFNQPFGR